MRSTPARCGSSRTGGYSWARAPHSSARCSPRSRCRCRSTRSRIRPCTSGSWVWRALLPIVIFGLYGGAVADAVDRRRLYLWSSLGTWVVTLALLAQTLLDLRNVARDPGARRRPVGDVRGGVVRARRDHPADRADRSGACGEHAEFHGRQRRAGDRPADRGRARVAASRLRLCLFHRRSAVLGGALLGVAAAVDRAGRLGSAGPGCARCSTDCGSSPSGPCW